MKKTIKLIDLDCGHCADKIQKAVQKIDGVNSVEVNFLSQKMVLDAPDDRFDAVLAEAKALIKKWNSQENRTPSRPDHAAGAHCAKQTRLTSGGRLSSFAVLRRRRL